MFNIRTIILSLCCIIFLISNGFAYQIRNNTNNTISVEQTSGGYCPWYRSLCTFEETIEPGSWKNCPYYKRDCSKHRSPTGFVSFGVSSPYVSSYTCKISNVPSGATIIVNEVVESNFAQCVYDVQY